MPTQEERDQASQHANAFVADWYGGFNKPSPGAEPRPPALRAGSSDETVREWLRWNRTPVRSTPWDELVKLFGVGSLKGDVLALAKAGVKIDLSAGPLRTLRARVVAPGPRVVNFTIGENMLEECVEVSEAPADDEPWAIAPALAQILMWLLRDSETKAALEETPPDADRD